MTALRDLLGVELPLIQAPMAGSQGATLAIAVARAGALGSLPCAMLSPDGVRSEVASFRATSTGPVNLNFFCHQAPLLDAAREAAWRVSLAPYYRELGLSQDELAEAPVRLPFDQAMADVVEQCRPGVVSFHFGLPSAELVTRVKAVGTRVLASATTVAEARWLEARGVDAIIAQGYEAGGHRGMFLSDDLATQVGTFALVAQLAKTVGVPVIAAGGIATASTVAAACALGAAGVQVGTAFLLCPEASTSVVHRAALASDAAEHTALTNLFTGRPARGIVTRYMREHGPMSPLAPSFPSAATAVAPLRARAESQGSGTFSPLWCGQNARGCRPLPAADLVAELAAGFAS